jgi:formamidopyrimidine-DNA glycosylase
MPELPEVETIRRQLAPRVQGRTLVAMHILDPRWSRPLAPEALAEALVGRRVEALTRRGKYLLWDFDGDIHLAQHLRMTGAVLYEPSSEPAHIRVLLDFATGRSQAPPRRDRPPGERAVGGREGSARRERRRVLIVDSRRFGTGQLLAGSGTVEDFFSARLGMEPLNGQFTSGHLRALTRGRSTPIKALLLDQRKIAGVGNIYADEALFRARVHPLRPAGRLSTTQLDDLRVALTGALRAGINARGATIADFRDLEGARGSFQDQFLVHRRGGQPCLRCGAAIVRIVVAGRGTYVCETCQPRPRRRRAPRSRRA